MIAKGIINIERLMGKTAEIPNADKEREMPIGMRTRHILPKAKVAGLKLVNKLKNQEPAVYNP